MRAVMYQQLADHLRYEPVEFGGLSRCLPRLAWPRKRCKVIDFVRPQLNDKEFQKLGVRQITGVPSDTGRRRRRGLACLGQDLATVAAEQLEEIATILSGRPRN